MTRGGFRASYTLSKAFNYSNDDQIPFGEGPIDPQNLRLEYGPTPNDQRHRMTVAGWVRVGAGVLVAPIWTIASGVPMDILLPAAQSRVRGELSLYHTDYPSSSGTPAGACSRPRPTSTRLSPA